MYEYIVQHILDCIFGYKTHYVQTYTLCRLTHLLIGGWLHCVHLSCCLISVSLYKKIIYLYQNLDLGSRDEAIKRFPMHINFSFPVKYAITRFALSQPCTAILLCIITNHQFFILICVNTFKFYVFSSISANSYGILPASLLSKMALVVFLKYFNCLAVFAHYNSFYIFVLLFSVNLKLMLILCIKHLQIICFSPAHV